MKSFWINTLAKLLVGGNLFDKVKEIVADLNNTELSGSEKKERALEDVYAIFADLSTRIVNLAIELAVAWAKSK